LSLTGNLEDLPLLDIIQIVSFSKKTGHLSIQAPPGEGGIVFRDGFVVAAFGASSPPLDSDFPVLAEAQKTGVIRRRIEVALEQLVRLREGQFSFALTDELPERLGTRDLAPETLATGINAQELLLDLARGMDEDRRHSSAAVEASFAEPDLPPDDHPGGPPGEEETEHADRALAESAETPPLGIPALRPPAELAGVTNFLKALRQMAPGDTPSSTTIPMPVVRDSPPAAAGARTVLLVDDEDDVRKFLAGIFTQGGYRVVEAADPEAAVKKGGKLAKDATPFVLVTDLGMPASGGTSFHGGFEVVKRLWKMNHRPPVLMMTESLSQALQLRARQMGIRAFVFKPGLSKLNPGQFEADLKAFGAKILADILPKLVASSMAPRPRPAKAEAAPARPVPVPEEGERSRDFTFLQRRLGELRQPGNANQIAVLVMKVAREYFERAILFLVKNEEARGLGGFGAGPKDENLGLLVRSVVIPLGEASPFLDVVRSGRSLVGVLPPGKWSAHLMGKIGRFQSREVALLPLVTHREPIAVLFGDNPETGKELGRLDALEVFIHQAGIALENAFLQKKLQSLEERA